MISLICLLISRVDFILGFAIGIFALFGILRYRTIPIMPREMTYIFLSAGIAAKNALVPMDFEIYKLFLTDASLLLIAGLLEYFLFRKKLSTKTIVYNNLDLIHPDKRPELIQDLNSRFGLGSIEKIQVGKIDTLKSAVRLQVFFKDPGEENLDED